VIVLWGTSQPVSAAWTMPMQDSHRKTNPLKRLTMFYSVNSENYRVRMMFIHENAVLRCIPGGA
jgi:hypothetical protein